MKTDRSSLKITILLVLLTAVALVATWSYFTVSVPSVSGDHGIEGKTHLTFADEDSDEIDPEACQTTTEKELEGPILTTLTVLDLPESVDGPSVGVLREQMIVKFMAACNVDDEFRDPNLERELDVDIEVFSIICEKRDDLSVHARCEVLRVAQEDNADFLQ